MHYKTVWISDLHLDTRGCDAPGLFDFPRQTDFERRFILIAEDEPDTANLLQFHLQRRGYRTTVAADGFKALNLTFEGHPDLVILDLMLPKLHGFEVCRMLKASPSSSEIPVFMLTAMASTENKVQGFSVGANDYMTKPFEVPELLARIESLLQRSRRQ